MLRTDLLTLLFVNLDKAEPLHTQVHEKLAAWKELIFSARLKMHAEHEEEFKELFGTKPSIVLVRPDGYAAFVGDDSSVGELANYFSTWFPVAEA